MIGRKKESQELDCYSRKECYYKLIDPFCLFYLHFFKSEMTNEDFFSQNISNYKMNIWSGFAFENVCFNHIEQIKFALGISGVSTESYAYCSKEDGIQIDMLLSPKDNVINLCEMKFYSDLFKVDKEDYLKINRRKNAIAEKVSKKANIRNTLITSYGLFRNEYSNVFTNVITLDDLFRF